MWRRAEKLLSGCFSWATSFVCAMGLLGGVSSELLGQVNADLDLNEPDKILAAPLSESAQTSLRAGALTEEWSTLSSQPGGNLFAAVQPMEAPRNSVEWRGLLKGSTRYLATMHAFRIVTEKGTRQALHNSLVGGYFKALGAMHGWSDGDGYYENYLGHPIEGAVSGYIWIRNDPRYRKVQFGADRDYWMSRLRAYAFAWAFSEQFEIGPISEASIGQIQRYCCAYGFVDHVVTPNGGLVWILAGDALDRYVTVPLERRTENKVVRIVARSALNPPQAFANLMMMEKPWRRENRQAVGDSDVEMYLQRSPSVLRAVGTTEEVSTFSVPKFEISGAVPSLIRFGNRTCLGGDGVGAFRATELLQWTVEVGGCTLSNSLPKNWTGDSLTFTAGPQLVLHKGERWLPRIHFRLGGQKVTEERENPLKKQELLAARDKLSHYRGSYIQHFEATGLSLSIGGELDMVVNRALAIRLANVEYVRSWLGHLNGTDFDHGVRFSLGLDLRIGTW